MCVWWLSVALLVTVITGNYYEVPSYYGYWNKNFYLYENLTQGTLRVLELHGSLDSKAQNDVVYYSDITNNCIYTANLTDNTMQLLAGTPGRAGNRVGSVTNTLFNGPMSISYFCNDTVQQAFEESLGVQVVNNASCLIDKDGCQLNENDTLSMSLGIQNIRFVSGDPSIDQTTAYLSMQDQPCTTGQQFLYVSDTNNHCIKKIDLQLQVTIVVAGQCGESGFMDGPQGFNRLNNPKNIGLTRNGDVIFFDWGNEYMRILTSDGVVTSLLNGACTQYPNNRLVKQYPIKKVICYTDWVEKNAPAISNHIFNPEDTTQTCTNHYSMCVSA